MNIAFLILGAALLFGVAQIDPLIFNIIQLFVIVTTIMLILLIIIC